MRYLMDSVALIFWWTDSPRLGAGARAVIEDGDLTIMVSAVSVWEIANKNRIGKLDALTGFEARFSSLLRTSGFGSLAVNSAHAMRAGYLPGAHRDPFDRLLAGQALTEDMTILTNDPALRAFGCKVLW